MCDVVSASTFTTKMDVWSLGATFFSLCSLRDFENEPSELARLVISEGLPELEKFDLEIAQVIKEMTAVNPNLRPEAS